ncbi:MAG: ComEC/Rec2 family competence protein [bacterium JZ-2024 1]
MRYNKTLLFIFLSLVPLLFCGPVTTDSSWLLTYILDVGQGDAVLIQDPLGGAALIDSGPPSFASRSIHHDIVALLRKYGVKSITLLIGTHPDADHIGGMPKVIQNFPVTFYLDPHLPKKITLYLDFLRILREKVKNGEIEYRQADEQKISLGKTVLEIFPAPSPPFPDPNDNSIVVRLRYQNWSILFTGDAEREQEQWLMEKFPSHRLRAEGLKAGHHGSSSSSSEEFLNVVSPSVVFISCGKNNRYGHPHPAVIDRLEKIGARIFRTDLLGTIRIRTNGNIVQVFSENTKKRLYSRKL